MSYLENWYEDIPIVYRREDKSLGTEKAYMTAGQMLRARVEMAKIFPRWGLLK